MPITVDALRNLAENQSVMLNAQTQGLERSSLSLRFRSAFGTRGAANANSQTLAAIRQAVVTDPRFSCVQQRASELFDRLNASKLVQTNAIRGILADLDAARELHAVNLRASALDLLHNAADIARPACVQTHPEVVARLLNHLMEAHAAQANGDVSTLTSRGLARDVIDVLNAVETAAGGDDEAERWALRHLDADPAAFATPEAATAKTAAYHALQPRFAAAAAHVTAQTFAALPLADGLGQARATGAALLGVLTAVADAMALADEPQVAAAAGGADEARAALAKAMCAGLPADTKAALSDALMSTGGLQLARFCQEAGNPRTTALFAAARALADALRAPDAAGPDFATAVGRTLLDATRLPTAAFALSPKRSLLIGPANATVSRLMQEVRSLPVLQDDAAFAASVRAHVADGLRDVYANERAKMGGQPNGLTPVFDKDIVRGLDVILPNGVCLAHDVAAAKDQIARYVAHDDAATFASLPRDLKARAERIVALCSQETEKVALHWEIGMFPNEEGFDRFTLAQANGGTRTFTLSEEADGSLGFAYEAEVPLPAILDGEGRRQTLGPGSSQRLHLAFSVAPDGALAVQSFATGVTAFPDATKHDYDMRDFSRLPERLGLTVAETGRLVRMKELETARGTDLEAFNDHMKMGESGLRRLFNYPAFLRDQETYGQATALLARFDAAYAKLTAGDARTFPPESRWFLERLVFDDLSLKLEAGGKLPKPNAFARTLAASNPLVAFMGLARQSASVGCTVLAMPAKYRESVVRALALLEGAHSPSVVNRLIGRRDDLLALAARGKLTRDNVLKTGWGNPVPQDIRSALAVKDARQRTRALHTALDFGDSSRLAAIGVTNLSPSFAACIEMVWKYGVDAQTALDIVEGRVPEPARALNPFEPMSVTSIQSAQDPAKAEEQLAKDIHRMRDGFTDVATNERRLVDAPSTFSFLLPDGTTLDLDSSANGLEAADAQKRDGGHPYSVSQQIRDAATWLCGEAHPMQIANVILGLAQGCVAPLRTQAAAHGVRATEHSQAAFRVEAVRDAHGQPTGDVAVHVTNLPGCPLVFDWTVTVHPDGSQDLSPVTMHRAADA